MLNRRIERGEFLGVHLPHMRDCAQLAGFEAVNAVILNIEHLAPVAGTGLLQFHTLNFAAWQCQIDGVNRVLHGAALYGECAVLA